MNLILEAEGVKREIVGPFNVCASKADLERLQSQISGILRDWETGGCSYGWATVYPKPEGPGPNSVPRKWTE